MAEARVPDSTVNQSIADYIDAMSMDSEATLRSIDLTLKAIARNDGLLISQSSLQDLAEAERQAEKSNRFSRGNDRNSTDSRNRFDRGRDRSGFDRNAFRGGASRATSTMYDDFTKAFRESLLGSQSSFKDMLGKSLSGFASSLGTDMDGLGKELGNRIGDYVRGMKFGDSTIGDQLDQMMRRSVQSAGSAINDVLNRVSSALGGTGDINRPLDRDAFSDAAQSAAQAAQSAQSASQAASRSASDLGNQSSDIGDSVSSAMNTALDIVPNLLQGGGGTGGLLDGVISKLLGGAGGTASAAAEAGTGLAAVSEGATSLAPVLAETGVGMEAAAGGAIAAGAAFPPLAIALLAAPIIIDAFTEALGPAIEGFQSFSNALSAAGNRVQTQNSKNLELWKNRVAADVKSATQAAFDIIEDAAKTAMDAWDQVAGNIAATQGYDKEGVQDLWSSYASTLRDKGLSSVVSSADIMTNLESVLQQGLYGKVAEEFAYMATVLNQAVPNQDFFQYASTYASIAANAVKNGKSQEEALNLANAELESFASNLLYANRQIGGGFATDIKNGAKLFEDAAKIALTSQNAGNRVTDDQMARISGTLTSVSALVSSIAPDLADGVVSAVIDAAVGGNSDSITALRSLANVGASNSAFLAALADDPQKVFGTLFENLARLQNMSVSNFMEVADGLSEVFGLSRDALARVDFAYLADAVRQMRMNTSALNENMALLKSGETTSTAEQLRMQKINEYMIEEGLAYVLDSEVGRAVQEHMWEEQLMREIEENTFAVDLQGSALEFLQGIASSVVNVLDFLNPLSWLKKIGNVALTAIEAAEQSEDISKILNAGVVGKDNYKAFTLLQGPTEADLRDDGLMSLRGRNNRSYVEMLTGEASGTERVRGVESIWNMLSGQFSTSHGLLGNNVGTLIGKSMANAMMQGKGGAAAPVGYYTTAVPTRTLYSYARSGDARIDDSANYNANFTDNRVKEQTRWLSVTYTDTKGKKQTVTDTGEGDAKERGSMISEAITQSISQYLKHAEDKTDSAFKDIMSVREVAQKSAAALAAGTSLTSYVADELERSKSKEIRGYLTQEEILERVKTTGASQDELPSFEEWAKKSLGMSVDELSAVLQNYGSDINSIRAKFEEQQSQEASKQSKARELHEVRFWEDMQRFATDLFPSYFNEWKKYFILHSAYTDQTQSAYAEALKMSEDNKNASADATLKLAEVLTGNDIWSGFAKEIADPTVQTNMLLSKILLILNTIMQQNNETSIVSVPTALSSLGLGIVTPAATAASSSSNSATTKKK